LFRQFRSVGQRRYNNTPATIPINMFRRLSMDRLLSVLARAEANVPQNRQHLAQRSEAGANLLRKELRLFPGRKVAAVVTSPALTSPA
jgi:hypothetical protein